MSFDPIGKLPRLPDQVWTSGDLVPVHERMIVTTTECTVVYYVFTTPERRYVR